MALPVSSAAKEAVRRLQTELSDFQRALKLVRPEQMHLTLKFLGETPAEQVPEIAKCMEEATRTVNAFEFLAVGTGCFPPKGRPRVVWIGIEESSGAMLSLFDGLETSLEEIGVPRESRQFRPHLTVARARDRADVRGLREKVAQSTVASAVCTADELVLFESILKPGGAQYAAVARARLAGDQP